MLGSMSAHLRVLVGMLDDLTLKDVETRLLNWLVKHERTATGGVIRLPGTKRVLAAELGHQQRNAFPYAGPAARPEDDYDRRSHHHRAEASGTPRATAPQPRRELSPTHAKKI